MDPLGNRASPSGRHRDDSVSEGGSPGVEANSRLTASTAVVLVVLLAVEGVTILRIRAWLTPHVFVGMLLVPPVLVKTASTTYRFVRYYTGSPAYRQHGPPMLVLRLMGPVVVVSTMVVFGSGIALILAEPTWRSTLLVLHKASFVVWFGALTVHVLGHLTDTARLAPRDWVRSTRRDVAGAGLRQWTIAGSLVAGVLTGLMFLGKVGPWLASMPHRFP